MSQKISVIIPVYNVKSYLNRCIESVLTQTYQNLEVIIVDDGSFDGSSEICDAFAQRDSRVKVLHQVNQGLSAARNAGIEISSGEWVAFLDSDDYVEPSIYEDLLNLAMRHNVDLCSCNSRAFNEDMSIAYTNIDTAQETIYSYREVVFDLVHQSKIRFEVWNKLWKRSLIGEVRFKVGQVCEDVYFDRILYSWASL